MASGQLESSAMGSAAQAMRRFLDFISAPPDIKVSGGFYGGIQAASLRGGVLPVLDQILHTAQGGDPVFAGMGIAFSIHVKRFFQLDENLRWGASLLSDCCDLRVRIPKSCS